VTPVDEKFDVLFHDHYGRVLAYALRRTCLPSAEEVVSETFAIAWRRIDDIPEEAVLPWLLAVARRTLANQRRGMRRREMLLGALRDRTRVMPTTTPESTSDAVRVALASLTERDRELLTLIAWDGLTPEEAARVVGTSAATCRVRLHRARQRFEKALDAVQGPRVARYPNSIAKEGST
jgi:RNA polymerase sigma-70 factor (ECF subfamily)